MKMVKSIIQETVEKAVKMSINVFINGVLVKLPLENITTEDVTNAMNLTREEVFRTIESA